MLQCPGRSTRTLRVKDIYVYVYFKWLEDFTTPKQVKSSNHRFPLCLQGIYTFNQMFPKYFFQVKFYWSFCVTSIRKISNQLPACFLGIWLPVVCYHFHILSNLIPWWFKHVLSVIFPFRLSFVQPTSSLYPSHPSHSEFHPGLSRHLRHQHHHLDSRESFLKSITVPFYYDGSSESNRQIHYFSISINHA